MAILHNRVSQKELKLLLLEESEPRITTSFYRYFPVNHPQEFRDSLYKGLQPLKVFGRIYVAKEGINAQVSVPSATFETFKQFLNSFSFLSGILLNTAVDDGGKSFWVLKIKVRDKIVADGITNPHFDMARKGKYVNARQMNELLTDPGTIVVDMRNHYEYEVGHFDKAIEVPSDTFRDQLPMAVNMLKDRKDKNIIMYCTGGIRCEKASAYMLLNGFNNVFHLEGGIINYARQVKEEGLKSEFKGKNFVFDDRLGERITGEIIASCHQCGKPADTHSNCKNDACHLLFIRCDECAVKYDGCCTPACQRVYHLPAEEQQKLREGRQNGIMIFNKSKKRLRPTIQEMEEQRKENEAGRGQ
ncbi:MAG: rhodanese-related sulfurtransferase [Gloeobacteraceae cyanobacterium ES-bin-316]|nr:rhodanese-related sulfurtransferase [Ferruginibacter sp.]